MILYCYDEHGVYTGPVSPALSPARPFVNGQPNYLRPARSTPVAPPASGPGLVAVFDGSAWSLVQDHRGEVMYSTATKEAKAVTDLGPIPDGWTLSEPLTPRHVWGGSGWEISMASVREEACAGIDAQAEALRLACITPGQGQALTYAEKERQAREFVADQAPTIEKYPLIFGESGITADTPLEVAQSVLARASAWWSYGAAVEKARLKAKRDIEKAIVPEQVAAIVNGVAWPTPPGV